MMKYFVRRRKNVAAKEKPGLYKGQSNAVDPDLAPK